ncbi:aminotransferase class III-fold pyridoxal phosphate-dependent enzyme, partial [Escherichia coli]|uniref:aminotransferase class III-fold pyridoxal phosphate-dependent enzyme n=1 Tax=Escherichia coli TaxID=562 RepID=UPI00202BB51C
MLFIDNLRVSRDDLIGNEGDGFRYLLHGLNPERILIAAEAIGLGQAALRRATQYACERVVFGRPIGQNQSIQHPLAQAWMQLEAAWLMVMKAATRYDTGQSCGAEANAAKYLGAEAAFQACQTAVATLGGMGYMHEQMPSKVEHIVHIDQPYFFGEAQPGETPEAFGLARAQQLEAKILELGAENVAAFIGEPFQGAGGVIFPPSTYWPEIQRICRKYDILLVADEVIGGFGRTGEWFAHQHFGFEPDLITMAKSLAGGMPLSGVVGRADVMDAAAPGGLGGTYAGNPLAVASAHAVLEIIDEEKLCDRATQLGDVL